MALVKTKTSAHVINPQEEQIRKSFYIHIADLNQTWKSRLLQSNTKCINIKLPLRGGTGHTHSIPCHTKWQLRISTARASVHFSSVKDDK